MNLPDTLQSVTAGPHCAAVGFFDGVHLGHAALLRDLARLADERGERALAITFDRHPRVVVQADYVPELLTTTDEKVELLALRGVECAVLTFDQAMAALSAREFMQTILRVKYNVKTLLVGYDHHFGRPQGETFADYARMGADLGIDVLQAEPFLMDGSPVSSSRIRRCLADGDVEAASRMLGRPYGFSARVVHGRHVGTSLGFPTANFATADLAKLLPANGSYLVRVNSQSSVLHGMLYVGTRPTFDASGRTAEVHLFDANADFYGQTLRVDFLCRLRQERRFESAEALRRQLEADRAEALRLLETINPKE